jgi:YHS domain-containing protein
MKKKIIIAVAAVLVVGGAAGAYFFVVAPANSELAGRPDNGYVEPPDDGTEVTDPVTNATCRKTFKTKSAVHEQKTYYFCCPHCPTSFLSDTDKYADPKK